MNDEFKYEEQDGEITITKYIGSGGEVVIPSKIDRKPVTKIEGNTFCDCSSLTSVVIPESITEIGCGAFDGCFFLKSVEIPEGVTMIGDNAFDGCIQLVIDATVNVYAQMYAEWNMIRFKCNKDKKTGIIGNYS